MFYIYERKIGEREYLVKKKIFKKLLNCFIFFNNA